jgi:asparagine synthase (glutamine-hydrolysing)
VTLFTLNANGTTVGPESFSTPDGPAGVSWKWDGVRLSVQSWPHGFFPVFLLDAPDRFAIATSLQELLPFASRELDNAALAVFLRLGFYVGEDTPFRAIRAAPAAQTFSWSRRGGIEASRTTTAIWSLDRDAAKKRFSELFRAAVAACRPTHQTVLPLSGGQDSRHILLELNAQRRLPDHCLTALEYPPASGDDATVAAMVAQRIGAPHRVLSRPRDQFAAELQKNRITDFSCDEHTWAMPLVRELDGKRWSIFDGLGGDVLSAGLRLTAERDSLYRSGLLSELAADMIGGGDRVARRFLARSLCKRFSKDLALERLIQELAKFAPAHNPLTQFYLWNRTRREVAQYTYGMLGRRHEVFAPFMDADLFDFLLSLPSSMLMGKTFHTEVIAESYPALADLRYENKGAVRRSYLAAAIFSARAAVYSRSVCSPAAAMLFAGNVARAGRLTHHLVRMIYLSQLFIELEAER